jgi:hypothetical protein
VRVPPWLLTAALFACHPSATVERTTPVANLQSYRTVGLSVRATAFASQGLAMYLEGAVMQRLQKQCGFEQVGRAGTGPNDVVLDLNITHSGRGGGGWVSNSGTAVIETLLVLSDGQNGDLLGTARIRGKSSGMIINGAPPENEAIEVVAKSIAELLAKSGCTGPRVARAEPPPPPNTGGGSGAGSSAGSAAGSGSSQGSGAPPVDDAKRAQAEQLNEDGKTKLRSADIAGALAAFQQANALVPDPRYQYNVCLTYEAQEQWTNAIAACKQARGMNPEPRLVAKIDKRLEMLAAHQ